MFYGYQNKTVVVPPDVQIEDHLMVFLLMRDHLMMVLFEKVPLVEVDLEVAI